MSKIDFIELMKIIKCESMVFKIFWYLGLQFPLASDKNELNEERKESSVNLFVTDLSLSTTKKCRKIEL